MLGRHGIRVPQDVSLIGYDQDNGVNKVRPLTTVDVDIEEQGRQLAQLAVRKTAARGIAVPEVIVPTVLVKNGTCRTLRLASAGLPQEEPAVDLAWDSGRTGTLRPVSPTLRTFVVLLGPQRSYHGSGLFAPTKGC